jgi:hypothetical protein
MLLNGQYGRPAAVQMKKLHINATTARFAFVIFISFASNRSLLSSAPRRRAMETKSALSALGCFCITSLVHRAES